MRNKLTNPKGMILAHLQGGRVITPRIAVALYDAWRLSSTICRLRKEFGYDAIKTTMRKTVTKKTYAEYQWMLN